MSILEDVVTKAENFEDASDQFVIDAGKLHSLIGGPASGAGSTVDLGGTAGVVKTPAKVIADADAALRSLWPAPLTISLTFDAVTTAGPAAGKFRLGSGTQKDSIVLRVSETDKAGNTAVGRLNAAITSSNPTKGRFVIIKYGDSSKYLVGRYTASADNGPDRDLTIVVEEYSATSPFAAADDCLLMLMPTGDKGANGADGAGSGDMQSDDATSTIDDILSWSTNTKHAKGQSFAKWLAGLTPAATSKVWGPWSSIVIATNVADISAANTVLCKVSGTGPVTSFGTARDGWLRIVRVDAAFTITRDATNLETPNQADVAVAVGDFLIVVRESSETVAKTQVLQIIKSDGRSYRGPNDIPQNLSFSGIISPAQITANQNDYAPTGHQTTLVERLNSDASRTITGLAAPTSGRAESRILINSGSQPIILSDADASSSAANRFSLGANFTIASGKCAMLWYDTTSSRWRPISQVIAFGALATLDRVTDIDQNFSLSGDISPTQLSANTNDWAPSGLATANVIRASTDASRNLTGMSAPATKRLLRIFNIGSINLVLKNEDSNSLAANRFSFGGDRTLAAGDGIVLWYDTTSSRWRASAVLPVAGGGGSGTTDFGACYGRLTLSSGNPVMGAAVTAATTVYFSPYRGSQIGLYDGVSTWSLITFTEKSIKLTDAQTGTTSSAAATITGLTDTSQLVVGMLVSGTGVPASRTIASIDSATQITMNGNGNANGSNTITFKLPASSVVDVFGYNNSGALKLEFAAWTNSTTRATAITTQDGVPVKTGALTRRYLGTIATTATDGQSEFSFGGSASGGTAANLLLWNLYWPEVPVASVTDTASVYTYSTATFRSANNSTANRINFVVGLATRWVSVEHIKTVYASESSAASRFAVAGIGLDSTTADSGVSHIMPIFTGAVVAGQAISKYNAVTAIGLHYVQGLEKGGPGDGYNLWNGGYSAANSPASFVGRFLM